jgi:hypothetical protein
MHYCVRRFLGYTLSEQTFALGFVDENGRSIEEKKFGSS